MTPGGYLGFHGLFETMYTALGESSLMGNLSDALLRVVTKRGEKRSVL